MTRISTVLIATVMWLLPAAGQNPVFQSEIRIVKEQKILSFEKLWYVPRASDGLPIGLPPKRRWIVLLDGLRQPPPGVIQDRSIQQGVSEMLKRIPQTEDTIAIFALGDELRMLHDFSPLKFGLRGAAGFAAGGGRDT
jgi:hypothetical protein